MQVSLNAGIGAFHPECRYGEVFVCYTNKASFHQIGWESKRMGRQVIDDEHHNVTNIVDDDIVPVFASEAEVYANA